MEGYRSGLLSCAAALIITVYVCAASMVSVFVTLYVADFARRTGAFDDGSAPASLFLFLAFMHAMLFVKHAFVATTVMDMSAELLYAKPRPL